MGTSKPAAKPKAAAGPSKKKPLKDRDNLPSQSDSDFDAMELDDDVAPLQKSKPKAKSGNQKTASETYQKVLTC